MEAKYTILIVEDDATIARLVAEELQKNGYEAIALRQFNHVLDEFQRLKPNLVLLDLGLPGRSGYEWCQDMRSISDVPIIFLSSHGENIDIVQAIAGGADDYIVKPFSMSIVIVKVQAMLRRAYGMSRLGEEAFHWGAVILELDRLQIRHGEAAMDLTYTEMCILKQLFQQRGQFVRREKLCEVLWEGEQFIDDNTLAVNITRIRRKLADIGLAELIVTKKGYGYGLDITAGNTPE